MEDIESMGIKQLKEFITLRGGDFSDCVEKSDLKKRAMQVAAAKPSTAPPATAVVSGGGASKIATPPRPAASSNGTKGSPVKTSTANADDELIDEDAEISDSDEEETTVTEKGKPQKRFSVFRVKKFMTAQIGKSSAGRATVMKVLGEDGDVVVQALKSLTTKMRDAKTARENKKDGIRFCLKAYNLWKHKDFTPENTRSLQADAQLLAEVYCRECTSVASGRRSDVSSLVRVANRTKDSAMKLMSPHIQPKNATRLLELLQFYASPEFFEALLNVKENEAEREAIEKSANTMLLPLTPLLSGERERTSLFRAQALFRVLDNKKFDVVLDHPQVAQMFQQYLDLELGLASKNGLRFLLAVRDFEKTASRDLMRMRAPKIVEKYLSPSAELKVEGIDPAVLKATLDSIASGTIGMGTFLNAVEEVRRTLEDDFLSQFVGSSDYEDLKTRTASEIARLEKQLFEEGSMVTTPARSGRKSVV